MELLAKPCASIDAELRVWDVLLGLKFRYSPTRQTEYKAKCKLLADRSPSWGNFMRRAALSSAVLSCLLLSFAIGAQNSKPVETIPLDQIHAGMRGLAYTVFQGTTPEPMDVEVLGVLKNANGPKGDVILVRLGGAKAEYTGVVAGMSGSPVYLNGKLAGALAFRIGEFSKEPIAGVTPIAEMLEISALDRNPSSAPIEATSAAHTPNKTGSPGITDAASQDSSKRDFTNYL